MTIEWDVQTDKFGNAVTLIEIGDKKYRLVHHKSKSHERFFATIYRKDKKFVRLNTYEPDNDCKVSTYTIATFKCEYGDGELLGLSEAATRPISLEIKNKLGNQDLDTFLEVTLGEVLDDIDWMTKAEEQVFNQLRKR